jgi:thiol-disulfide isomerase/thioredoxin
LKWTSGAESNPFHDVKENPMLTRIVSVAVLGLCLTTAAWAGDEDESKSMTIGDKAPPIDIAHWIKGVKVERGKPFKPITEFGDGKVYVLEFWATWCGPCRAGMPHLSEMQAKYKDYGVKIIGVSDEPLPVVTEFLFQTDRNDGKLNNDRTQYILTTDPDESVKKDYFIAAGQRGIPCAFIIGQDGHVEWIGHPMTMDEPLHQVVHGEWDRAEFKTKWEQEQAVSRYMTKMRAKIAAAYQNKEWDKAVSILDEGLEKFPTNTQLLYQKFGLLLTFANRPKEAYRTGEKLLKSEWDNAQMLNGIAWMIVDDENVPMRDLDFAIKAATRANELTNSEDPAILDTLARVYYEKGELEKAVKWQKKAVDHAGEDQMGQMIRETFEKYEKEFEASKA